MKHNGNHAGSQDPCDLAVEGDHDVLVKLQLLRQDLLQQHI